MLCINNNLIKYHLSHNAQLNDQIVLFQTIQFNKYTVFCLHIVKCKNS